MTKWIKQRRTKIIKERRHDFIYDADDDSYARASFYLDEEGNLLRPNPDSEKNYKECLSGFVRGKK